MKVVIPVAGLGNRLKPHTFNHPKVLLPVAGKPILGHILDSLKKLPISEYIFITGNLGEMIEQYVNENYQIKARFVLQKEQQGLGHAIYVASPFFGKEPLLIILGDTIFDANLLSLVQGKESALCVKEVEDPSRFGVAIMENNRIKRLVEKPAKPISKLALVGIYFIRESKELKQALEQLIKRQKRTRGEYQLTDALQIMLQNGIVMRAKPVDGWYDCGKPETMLSTNRFLLNRNGKIKDMVRLDGSVIIPPIYIHPSAVIRNSVIGPFVSLGPKAIIQESVVSDSLIGEEAKVIHATIQESLVGNGASIIGRKQKFNVGDSSIIELA